MAEDNVIRNIKKMVEILQTEITAMQNGILPKSDYRKKVKELMFWRRSLIRRKKKIGLDEDDES